MLGFQSLIVTAVAVEHAKIVLKAAAENIEKLVEQASLVLVLRSPSRVWEVRNRLHELQLYLKDADQRVANAQGQANPTFKSWIEEVYDAAMDTQDLVDMYAHLPTQGTASCLPSFCTGSPNPPQLAVLFSSSEFGYKLRNIESRLTEIEEKTRALGLSKQGASSSTSPSVHSESLWKSSKSIFEGDTCDDVNACVVQEIMSLVRENRVVAVVGMAGSGKTQLLQHVFNRIKFSRLRFQGTTPIWLRLSQQSTVSELQSDIYDQISRITYFRRGIKIPNPRTEEEFFIFIKETLCKFRSLMVVVDEAWDVAQKDGGHRATVAEKLRAAGLPLDKPWSKVLISTRNYDVGSDIDPQVYIYHMPFLSESQSQQLLLRHLFPHSISWFTSAIFNDSHSHERLMKNFVKLSRGLPLTILILAGILKHQHPNEWPSTLQQLGCPEDAEHALYRALTLSFNAMEHNVKPCFGYLGALAQYETIDSDKLIGMWKAEGLVAVHSDGVLMLMHLANRSLVQLLHQDRGTTSSSYTVKVHDTVHTLAVSVFMESGGAGQILEQQFRGKRISRISLSKARVSDIPSTVKCPASTRALRLNENPELHHIPSQFWENASGLRTLDLSYSNRLTYGDALGRLKFLKFLDLTFGVSILKFHKFFDSRLIVPECVRNLKLLEHLYTSWIRVPAWIHEFQRLTHFSAHKSCHWTHVDDIILGLMVVRGSNVMISGNTRESNAWTWHSLSQLTQLQEVTLCCNEFLNGSMLPDSLVALTVRVGDAGSRRGGRGLLYLPLKWQELSKLQHLKLESVNLPRQITGFQSLLTLHLKCVQEYPAALCQLPQLRILHLNYSMRCKELPVEFGSRGAFPCLRTLRLSKLYVLQILPKLEEEGMPSLVQVEIEDCPELREPSTTQGWEHKIFLELKLFQNHLWA